VACTIWVSTTVFFKVAQIRVDFIRKFLVYFSVLKKNDTLKPEDSCGVTCIVRTVCATASCDLHHRHIVAVAVCVCFLRHCHCCVACSKFERRHGARHEGI